MPYQQCMGDTMNNNATTIDIMAGIPSRLWQIVVYYTSSWHDLLYSVSSIIFIVYLISFVMNNANENDM